MANRPVLHRRDHEHGGADPVRILWESTGEAGEGGGGIQFDTDNEGGWLYVQTNDATEGDGAVAGFALDLQDHSTSSGGSGGIRLFSSSNGILLNAGAAIGLLSGASFVNIQSNQVSAPFVNGVQLKALTSGISITGNTIEIQGHGAAGQITINETGQVQITGSEVAYVGGASIGFFGVTPVAQPATPTTTADVIAALQALGLVA
jgi:hypothetical protein